MKSKNNLLAMDQFEFGNLCRLCLCKDDNRVNIFNEEDQTTLRIQSKLTTLFPLHFNENEEICFSCLKIVNSFYSFYVRVIDNQTHFTTNISEQKISLTTKISKQQKGKHLKFYKDDYFINPSSSNTKNEESHTPDANEKLFPNFKEAIVLPVITDNKQIKEDAASYCNVTLASEKPLNILVEDFFKLTEKRENESEEDEEVKKTNPKLSKKMKIPIKAGTKKTVVDIISPKEKLKHLTKQNEGDDKIMEFFKLECQLCQEKFSKFYDVRAHYRNVHSIKRGYVTCCNKKFTRRAALLEHMDWHTNPDAFRCSICHKIYNDQFGLKLHMHHHASSEEKIYSCDVCGKSYSIKYHLLQHLRLTHFTEKNHKCPECDKTFGLNSVLQAHRRNVHQNANRYVCDICAKVFQGKQQCQRHRLDHDSVDKPKVQCNMCGAWLKNELYLRKHVQRIHIDQPQACKICGKISANKTSLQKHVRYVHENNRINKCTICDKAFKNPIGLKEHMASHTGDILYSCTYCPKTFNSNANKHSHRKRAHPVEWQRDRQYCSKST